jgi:predicted MPP superfamily phosphohydrolase
MNPLRAIYQRRTAVPLRVRHVDLRSRGLDLGVRLLLASDLHARDDWFDREAIASVVDAINRVEDIDVVLLLGDFVGNDLSAIDWSADEYARIEAPTAGVLGNHDHWLDAAYIQRTLEQAGVEMLTNRAMPLAQVARDGRGGNAWIAGIDSAWTRRNSTGPGADADAAFADVPPDADVIVLGHEPWLATLHEHALHVAGHTHCGQVRTPFFGDRTARMHMPRFSEPYPCRLYEVETQPHSSLPDTHRTTRSRRWIYTTGGVGYSTIDLRLFCPPELVVISA